MGTSDDEKASEQTRGWMKVIRDMSSRTLDADERRALNETPYMDAKPTPTLPSSLTEEQELRIAGERAKLHRVAEEYVAYWIAAGDWPPWRDHETNHKAFIALDIIDTLTRENGELREERDRATRSVDDAVGSRGEGTT